MKLLHTSDWHVGRKIRGRSRADEHVAVLQEIVDVAAAQRVDMTLVAGDLFDVTSPTPDDEKLVYRTLLDLAEVGNVAVVGGNHDSGGRLEAVRPLMEQGRITVAGVPKRPDEGGVVVYDDLQLKLALLPFVSKRSVVKAAEIMRLDPDQLEQAYEGRVRQVIEALTEGMGTETVNVVVSHLTVVGGTTGGGERHAHVFDYAVPQQAFPSHLSYVALGHLHRQQKVPAAAPVHYSGSPMQLDFGEVKDIDKGVVLVEVEPGAPAQVTPLPISGSRRLVQLEGTLEEVTNLGRELDDAYVRVILDEPARAGLNDDVRAAIPGVIDVVVSRSAGQHQTVPASPRVDRSPSELFGEYLTAHGFDDDGVMALFRQLEAEVHEQ